MRKPAYTLVLLCTAFGVSSCVGTGTKWNNPVDPTRDPPDNLVTISVPQTNATVTAPNGFDISGIYAEGLNEDIWLIIWDISGGGRGSGFPYLGPARKIGGTSWLANNANLGTPPRDIEITAYTASQPASTELKADVADWVSKNSFTGLRVDELPQGLVEQHTIRVHVR